MINEKLQSVFEIISAIAPFYLSAYNGRVEIVNFPDQNHNQIGARGQCPHCPATTYFRPVTPVYKEALPEGGYRVVTAAQCEACKGFVLVIGIQTGHNHPVSLQVVFPLGKPNDVVDERVQPTVAEDFKEALRCHWIKAYKACVVMCRRSVQVSVLELGAKPGRLVDQIDDLFTKGKITESLKDFAHEVRLTGNDGAHPDKDGLVDVSEGDASDIIEFTREYLHHVYVMPAKLKARKPPTSAAPANGTAKP